MVASSGPGDPTVTWQGVALRLEGLPFCGTVFPLAQVRHFPELRRVSLPLGRREPAVWSFPESALQGRLAWETPGSVPDVRH